MTVFCVLGNQLFDPRLLPVKNENHVQIFMREDAELCTHFKYHQQKILFFLSAMRKHARELEARGFQVHYEKLGEHPGTFDERLLLFLKKKKSKRLDLYEIEDKFFETRLRDLAAQAGVELVIHESPMFLTSRAEASRLLKRTGKPFMKTFYEAQRKRLKILLNKDGTPKGGQWSFDEDNRKPLPKGHVSPRPPSYVLDDTDLEVALLVETAFADHPGRASEAWLPMDRRGAHQWAQDFFENRFRDFGPYEDALSQESPFLHHSVLTPFLNTGLITPNECVDMALKAATEHRVPINSLEGFIRQVIGWREFVRGIYQNYSEIQDQKNFFGHHKKLTPRWYSGETGVPPLDDVIRKAGRYAYAHHIERLMVVGSLMLLLEVEPAEAHRWFMEMFIDSSDWVMGPNVYGMALFSDGGIFATKPYICGSNYYRKMAGYAKADWCDGVDGLYWGFVNKQRQFLLRNPRTSMMVRTYDKMSAEKIKTLEAAAQKLRCRLVR